jgi:hypothetical protein
MYAHMNYKTGKAEEMAANKRARSLSTTTESEEGSSSHGNPPKKKREEHKGRTAGGNKDFRHWPPSRPSYEQDRGYSRTYQQNRQENNYGHDTHGPPIYGYGHHGAHDGFRGAAASRARCNHGRGRGRSGNRQYY